MNRHFEDARYYLRRAADHLVIGAQMELAPIERRARILLGREREEPPSGRERVKVELRRTPRRVELGGKRAVRRAKSGIDRYRGGSTR